MTTKRESLIAGLVTALGTVLGAQKVGRSLRKAYSSEDGTMLVVHAGASDPNASMIGVVDRTTEVLLTVVSRSDEPEAEADVVMETAHPIVMAYQTADAAVMDISEGRREEPRYAGDHFAVCLVTTRYTMKYRTQPNNL